MTSWLKGNSSEQVWDIDRKKALESPQRVELVTQYILEHFDQKTYHKQADKSYTFSKMTNIAETASSKKEIKAEKTPMRISGFNSIFCVNSVPMARKDATFTGGLFGILFFQMEPSAYLTCGLNDFLFAGFYIVVCLSHICFILHNHMFLELHS